MEDPADDAMFIVLHQANVESYGFGIIVIGFSCLQLGSRMAQE